MLPVMPLILVAWADGKLDSKERPQILAAAKEQGIAEDSPAAKLLEHWLDTPPSPELAPTWKHYVRAVAKHLSNEARLALQNETLRRARGVAKASGGALGFGAISEDEERVISELEQTFDE